MTYTRGNDLSGTIQGAGLPAIASASAGGIGGLLARTDNNLGTSAYHFADGNGNVTCLTDGNEAVAASYLYDPYGRILSQSGWLANANLYRFSSKEFHVNSGLVYYLYRFYDPNLQRWISRDPIQENGGVNLYAFVGNDSVGFADTDGLDWWPPTKWPFWPRAKPPVPAPLPVPSPPPPQLTNWWLVPPLPNYTNLPTTWNGGPLFNAGNAPPARSPSYPNGTICGPLIPPRTNSPSGPITNGPPPID